MLRKAGTEGSRLIRAPLAQDHSCFSEGNPSLRAIKTGFISGTEQMSASADMAQENYGNERINKDSGNQTQPGR